ncbi:MAG: hypothetical protein IJP70_09630 [Bacteroidales bacterium]|nr:hypothetical protein [Bacteroidales bacterium]
MVRSDGIGSNSGALETVSAVSAATPERWKLFPLRRQQLRNTGNCFCCVGNNSGTQETVSAASATTLECRKSFSATFSDLKYLQC